MEIINRVHVWFWNVKITSSMDIIARVYLKCENKKTIIIVA